MPKFSSSFLNRTSALCLLCLGYSAQAFELPEVKRPIKLQRTESQFAVSTLRDKKRSEGLFSLGGSLLSIGRTDLTGSISFDEQFPGELNSQLLNAAAFNEFEQPLGGHFPLPNEKPVSLQNRNANGLYSTKRIRLRSTQ